MTKKLAGLVLVFIFFLSSFTSVPVSEASHLGIEFLFDNGDHFIAGEPVRIRLRIDFTVGALFTIQLVRLDTSEVKNIQTFVVPAAINGFSTINYEYKSEATDFFPFSLVATDLDAISRIAFIAILPNSIASSQGAFDNLALDTVYIVDASPDFELRLNDYTFKQGEYIVVWHRLETVAESVAPDIVEHVSNQDVRSELQLYDVAFNSNGVVLPINKPPEATDNPRYTLLVPVFEGETSTPFTDNTHAIPNSGLFVIGLDKSDQSIDRFTGGSGTMAARTPDKSSVLGATWTNQVGTWSVDGSGKASPTASAASGPYTFSAVTTLQDGATAFSNKTFSAAIDIDTVAAAGSVGIVTNWTDSNNHWRFIITWDATPADATFSIGNYNAGVLSEVASGAITLAVDDVVNLFVSVDKEGTQGNWTILALKGDQSPTLGDNVTVVEPLLEFSFADNTLLDADGPDTWGLIATSAVDAANVLNRSVEYIAWTALLPSVLAVNEPDHAQNFVDQYGLENPVVGIAISGKSFEVIEQFNVVSLNSEQLVKLAHPDAKVFTSFNSKVLQDTGTATRQELAYSYRDSRTLNLGTVVCCSDDTHHISLELASTRVNSRTGSTYVWILATEYTVGQVRSVVGGLNRLSGSFGMGDTKGHIAFAFILSLLVTILMLHFSLTGSIIAGTTLWIGLVVIGYVPPWTLMFLVLIGGLLNVTGLLSREV
ncbi:hypothetical protein LCGC14_0347940 [marine sediment metagenome]|uniref:Uncharacterized protein n=1 Tax=marine sediment metagenome TaxID=412755 RepID=A0A0F9TUT1_9ZZZZ